MSSSDHSFLRPWIVCERGDRWTTALRRFLPELTPSPLVASISHFEPSQFSALLTPQRVASQPWAVLVWEIDGVDFVACCDRITQTAVALPAALQLAAAAGLSRRERLVLSEFPVAATIRHPEHLPSLRVMIQGHFARVA